MNHKIILAEQLAAFEETICPCAWLIKTPEHVRKNCPNLNFASDKEFVSQAITSSLLAYREAVKLEKLGKPNLRKDHPEYKRMCEDNEINDEVISQVETKSKEFFNE